MEPNVKKNEKRNPSSLLLQPGSLPTWSVQGNPIFMPVAVATSEQPSAERECSSTSQASESVMLTSHLDVTSTSIPQSDASIVPNHQPCVSSIATLQQDMSTTATIQQGVSLTATLQPDNNFAVEQQTASNDTLIQDDNSVDNESEAHWFFQEIVENKELWHPFSALDSSFIETLYQNELKNPTAHEVYGPVIGSRYDVHLKNRVMVAVYWKEDERKIRRCTWFYKAEGSQHYIPYDEVIASAIEARYRRCLADDKWQQRTLINDEVVLFDGPFSVTQYHAGNSVSDGKSNIRTLYRGIPIDIVIPESEPSVIDHLVFIVPGIGSVCDLRFRSVSECVDGFRDIANKLIPVHFKDDYEMKRVTRVEFLPVAWHSSLHDRDMGFDRSMEPITLPSIQKLRRFTNDTLLDILLYSSPKYCQAIINTVSNELNRLHKLFLSRNPLFKGSVSLSGHSLGSLILFDILSNQQLPKSDSDSPTNIGESEKSSIQQGPSDCTSNSNKLSNAADSSSKLIALFDSLGLQQYLEPFLMKKMDVESLMVCDEKKLEEFGLPVEARNKLLENIRNTMSKKDSVSLTSWSAKLHTLGTEYPGTVVPSTLSTISFPKLNFNPACFFALGSPIAMFLVVRGFTSINKEFHLPTCSSLFHIFHPYDPVAFRIEPMVVPCFKEDPVLVPHHKGRKRMHREIRENISKVGAEMKQKFCDTLNYTLAQFGNIFSKETMSHLGAIEAESDQKIPEVRNTQTVSQISEPESAIENNDIDAELSQIDAKLNSGRRIDFVLQEKPIEALNEYIFALSSHATYWNSEDTALFMLKEVYSASSFPSVHGPLEIPSFSIPKPAVSKLQCIIPAASSSENDQSKHTEADSNNAEGGLIEPLSFSQDTCEVQGDTCDAQGDTLLPTQPLAPPPLSGFVRKSPFAKR